MQPREEKLLATVDALSEDIFELTAALVREPSTLGHEQSALTVMERAMTDCGWTPERVPMDTARLAEHPAHAPTPWDDDPATRHNLAAVVQGQGQGRSCLFNGHLDVVSPEPLDLWDRDPFEPFVADGWMHGRGAGDMKAGVAAMTLAAHAVAKAGFALNGDLTVSAVIEEECSGNGALALLQAGYDADAVLIPEPFGPTTLTAQVGVMWFKVELRGLPGHVLQAPAGSNPIEGCAPLWAALRDLERAMNDEPRPEAYGDVPHPLHLNIGMVKGGDWPSTVSAQAEFHGRLSFFPGESFAQARARVERALKTAAQGHDWLRANPPRVEFYGFRSEGHVLKADEPMAGVLAGCHRDLTGNAPQPYIATCTTDLRAWMVHGRARGTCYGPVAERIHGANERVRLDSVMHTARTYALFLARWCGLND